MPNNMHIEDTKLSKNIIKFPDINMSKEDQIAWFGSPLYSLSENDSTNDWLYGGNNTNKWSNISRPAGGIASISNIGIGIPNIGIVGLKGVKLSSDTTGSTPYKSRNGQLFLDFPGMVNDVISDKFTGLSGSIENKVNKTEYNAKVKELSDSIKSKANEFDVTSKYLRRLNADESVSNQDIKNAYFGFKTSNDKTSDISVEKDDADPVFKIDVSHVKSEGLGDNITLTSILTPNSTIPYPNGVGSVSRYAPGLWWYISNTDGRFGSTEYPLFGFNAENQNVCVNGGIQFGINPMRQSGKIVLSYEQSHEDCTLQLPAKNGVLVTMDDLTKSHADTLKMTDANTNILWQDKTLKYATGDLYTVFSASSTGKYAGHVITSIPRDGVAKTNVSDEEPGIGFLTEVMGYNKVESTEDGNKAIPAGVWWSVYPLSKTGQQIREGVEREHRTVGINSKDKVLYTKNGIVIGSTYPNAGTLITSENRTHRNVIKLPLASGRLATIDDLNSTPSDEKLKHDIKSPEKTTNDIHIKEFIYNDKDEISYGVIAQEVEKAGLGNLVHEKSDGFKGVDYISLLSLMINDLRNEIKDLKNEIKELKHV